MPALVARTVVPACDAEIDALVGDVDDAFFVGLTGQDFAVAGTGAHSNFTWAGSGFFGGIATVVAA